MQLPPQWISNHSHHFIKKLHAPRYHSPVFPPFQPQATCFLSLYISLLWILPRNLSEFLSSWNPFLPTSSIFLSYSTQHLGFLMLPDPPFKGPLHRCSLHLNSSLPGVPLCTATPPVSARMSPPWGRKPSWFLHKPSIPHSLIPTPFSHSPCHWSLYIMHRIYTIYIKYISDIKCTCVCMCIPFLNCLCLPATHGI